MVAMAVAEEIAHTQTVRASVREMAREMQELFGRRVLATILGIADPKAVARYATGDQQPHQQAERRLRSVFHVAKLLGQVESPQTIRAWFMGMNPLLEDRAPASIIRTEPERVMLAARAFLAHG